MMAKRTVSLVSAQLIASFILFPNVKADAEQKRSQADSAVDNLRTLARAEAQAAKNRNEGPYLFVGNRLRNILFGLGPAPQNRLATSDPLSYFLHAQVQVDLLRDYFDKQRIQGVDWAGPIGRADSVIEQAVRDLTSDPNWQPFEAELTAQIQSRVRAENETPAISKSYSSHGAGGFGGAGQGGGFPGGGFMPAPDANSKIPGGGSGRLGSPSRQLAPIKVPKSPEGRFMEITARARMWQIVYDTEIQSLGANIVRYALANNLIILPRNNGDEWFENQAGGGSPQAPGDTGGPETFEVEVSTTPDGGHIRLLHRDDYLLYQIHRVPQASWQWMDVVQKKVNLLGDYHYEAAWSGSEPENGDFSVLNGSPLNITRRRTGPSR